MSKNPHKDYLNELQNMHMSDHLGKWYSWDSPIGLSIFFLTLTGIGVIITNLVVSTSK